MGHFYHLQHRIVIFVFPGDMAPYGLCFYMFYVLRKVGQRTDEQAAVLRTVDWARVATPPQAFPVLLPWRRPRCCPHGEPRTQRNAHSVGATTGKS